MRIRIPSTALARLCVALLVVYPVSAWLVWAYLAPEKYGIMAALFAANAGTAILVELIFGLRESTVHGSGALRFLVLFIAVVCGIISALFWMTDEVEDLWLRLGMVSPVVLILLVLMGFVNRAGKEGTKTEGEG